jgi:hypothetical protein
MFNPVTVPTSNVDRRIFVKTKYKILLPRTATILWKIAPFATEAYFQNSFFASASLSLHQELSQCPMISCDVIHSAPSLSLLYERHVPSAFVLMNVLSVLADST